MEKLEIYGTLGPACANKEILKQMFFQWYEWYSIEFITCEFNRLSRMADNLT